MRVKIVPGELRGPNGPVATRVGWATTFRARWRGVLGRRALDPDEALVISPCRQVHTYGVGYELDVVFCDRTWRVLHVQTMSPGSVSRRVPRSVFCVELLGGRAAACGIERGVRLSFGATL